MGCYSVEEEGLAFCVVVGDEAGVVQTQLDVDSAGGPPRERQRQESTAVDMPPW
jgi:hypothetical protein